jgi:hypothetical protein
MMALGLAYFSSSFTNVSGLLPFSSVLVAAALIIWLGWRLIKPENPGKWLLYLTIGAAILRLAVGVFWFVGLPIYGHPNETQQSGYIMFDAYRRDTASWELAKSDESLISAFQGASHMDQYGGLLFISGFVYRFLAADTHYPLQMVVITASFSAVAVFFVWALSKQVWGDKAGKTAAWILTLYPEAVLLGSSQMREAFTISLVTGLCYYLIRFWKTQRYKYILYGGFIILFTALISWPIAVIEILITVVISLTLYPWHSSRRKWLILSLLGTLVVFLLLVGFFTFDWWKLVIDYQMVTTLEGSGKLDAVFGRMPDWLHFPFLIIYGVLQPLLPAALVAYYSGWLPYAIAIWRALGWTLLLGGFLYANFLAIKQRKQFKIELAMVLIVWSWIVVAAIRGGGDMWDNPRYRMVISGVQTGLVAWALFVRKETQDPWFKRFVVFVGIIILFFLAWYIDRKVVNYGFPIIQLNALVVISLICGAVYITIDWWRTRNHYD